MDYVCTCFSFHFTFVWKGYIATADYKVSWFCAIGFFLVKFCHYYDINLWFEVKLQNRVVSKCQWIVRLPLFNKPKIFTRVSEKKYKMSMTQYNDCTTVVILPAKYWGPIFLQLFFMPIFAVFLLFLQILVLIVLNSHCPWSYKICY